MFAKGLRGSLCGTVYPVRGASEPQQSRGPVELFGRAAVTHVQGLAQRWQRLVHVQGSERPAYAGPPLSF